LGIFWAKIDICLILPQILSMSKRSAKKRIVTGIASAIDELLMTAGMDDRTFDEKTELLFKIYDDAMSSINSTWKIKDRSAVKQHYSKLYADVKNGIQAITGKK